MGALYRLTSPSGKCYIGITSRDFNERIGNHIVEANRGSQRLLCRAIRKYGAEAIKKEILAIANDWSYLCELERKAIKVYGSKNPAGYNSTDGGEGTVGLVFSEERLAQSSVLMKTYFSNPKNREKQSTIKKAECNTPDGRKRLREVHARPEVKAKVSANASANWSDPELRAKMTASIKASSNTPESRARRSKALKKVSNTPEVKARLSAMAKNRRWIYRGDELRNVPSERLQEFLDNGWAKGMPKRIKLL